MKNYFIVGLERMSFDNKQVENEAIENYLGSDDLQVAGVTRAWKNWKEFKYVRIGRPGYKSTSKFSNRLYKAFDTIVRDYSKGLRGSEVSVELYLEFLSTKKEHGKQMFDIEGEWLNDAYDCMDLLESIDPRPEDTSLIKYIPIEFLARSPSSAKMDRPRITPTLRRTASAPTSMSGAMTRKRIQKRKDWSNNLYKYTNRM